MPFLSQSKEATKPTAVPASLSTFHLLHSGSAQTAQEEAEPQRHGCAGKCTHRSKSKAIKETATQTLHFCPFTLAIAEWASPHNVCTGAAMYHFIYCEDSIHTTWGWPTVCYSAPLQAPTYTGLNKPEKGITELLLASFATCCQVSNFSGPEDWSRKAHETAQSCGTAGLYPYTLEKQTDLETCSLKERIKIETKPKKPQTLHPSPTNQPPQTEGNRGAAAKPTWSMLLAQLCAMTWSQHTQNTLGQNHFSALNQTVSNVHLLQCTLLFKRPYLSWCFVFWRRASPTHT